MGVIVAAGMMSGLALMLAQMTRQQAVTQRKAETGLDMNQLHHRIIGVLYDGDACLKTLTDGNDRVYNGRTLQKLLNKGGKTVVERGRDINRTVRVEKMVIQGIPSSRTGQTEEGHLIITIKKLGVANEGMGEIIKKFPLTLELESASSNKLVRCHHTLDSKEHAIHTNICKSLGGEMEGRGSPTTECTLTGVYKTFCESVGGEYTDPAVGVAVGKCDMNPSLEKLCDSMQGTYTAGTPIGSCNIEETYVDVKGDTMTGDLNAPNVHASSTVTAGGGGGNPLINSNDQPQYPSDPNDPNDPNKDCDWTTPCEVKPGETPPPLKNLKLTVALCSGGRIPTNNTIPWSQLRGHIALAAEKGLISGDQKRRFKNFAKSCSPRSHVGCNTSWRKSNDNSHCRKKYSDSPHGISPNKITLSSALNCFCGKSSVGQNQCHWWCLGLHWE